MPCLSPITVSKRGYVDLRVTVACGQCIGCRVDRTRDWATRIVHEASLHELNIFVTLTYDDQHLPANGSLVKKDFQDFMKRLRKKHGKVRYFAVGEYGDDLGRPHYHAILFGVDFSDKRPHSKNDRGDQLYTSELLDATWGKGLCNYGQVSVASATYVAKYCIKKVNGSMAAVHYGDRAKEFAVMSLKPGIGQGWLDKWKDDVYPSDFVVIQGKKRSPPRYYDEQLDPFVLEDIKSIRRTKALKYRSEQTPERLKARQACLEARINLRKPS